MFWLCIRFYPNHYKRNGTNITKLELTKALAERCDIPKADAASFVNIFFSEIAQALSEGERVEIRGFCSFKIKEYDGYTGRNPKTGEIVQVPPKKSPFFKCGKDLKDRVDYRH